jgi:PGF-CTERM protein
VLALLVSILLVTSAAAPAFAADGSTADDSVAAPTGAAQFDASQTETASTVVTAPGASSRVRSPEHPASTADGNVTPATEDGPWNATGQERSLPSNATTIDVTLITGQTVTVVETENRTRYRVSADDRMRKVATPNATYVFPKGVDFETFDRKLFDVQFLVQQNLTDAETDSIPVIVSEEESRDVYVHGQSDDDSVGVLDSVSGTEKTRTLESIDAAAGEVRKDQSASAYEELATDGSVEKVSLDVKYRVELDNTDDAVSASSARQTYDVNGSGVTVAVLDTGIDETHPAIDEVVDHRDFTNDGTTDDLGGHGTHVAGIVASDNATYTGMAPGAELMNVRVLNSDGVGYTSWIIDGMEYADNSGADIISMSLGSDADSHRSNDPYTDAVDKVTNNGTLVVVSAGNSGSDYRTVGSPGITKNSLTVGASDRAGWYASDIAGFSSRGPTPHGYFTKPDVVAPGVGVVSAASSDDSDTTGDFTTKSGTSMAAPAVSGIAALVMEKHPGWGPERVKNVITSTSDSLGSYDVYTQGAGEVNATDALDSAVSVSPGTIDFGRLGDEGLVNRTVTVTNLGNTEVTLDASASATNIDTGETTDVGLNRTQVTVPAGGTAHLNLTVNTSDAVGVYSGRVSLAGGEYSAIFGFTKGENDVTIEKRGIDGTSTEGDFVWLFPEDTGSTMADGGKIGQIGADGTVTFNVTGTGDYHIFSDGVNEQTGESIVMSDSFSASGSSTQTLDESNTASYAIDTSEIEAETGPLDPRNVEVTYVTETDAGAYITGFSTGDTDATTVRFSQDDSLEASVERLFVPSDAGENSFDTSEVYHLIHTTSGVSGSQTTTVEPADLSEKRVTYTRDAESQTYNATLSAVSDTWYGFDSILFDYVVEVEDGVGDRYGQSIYVNDGVGFHGVGAAAEDDPSSWSLGTSYTFSADSEWTTRDQVNRHPYTGRIFWGFDYDEDQLQYYDAVAQSDQGFHVFEDGSIDESTLTINGQTEATHSFSDGRIWDASEYSVSQGDDVTLEVVGNNAATTLSTRTVTTYSTTYERDGDNQPPEIGEVNVTGLNAENTDGRTVTVRFTVGGNPDSLTAMVGKDAATVPFDSDGSGWDAMSVEKAWESGEVVGYVATYDPGEHAGTLDLAVRATDADGNVVESTTFDAFRVDSKQPTVTVQDVGSGETASGTSDTVYTNGSVTMNFAADGTPPAGVSSPVEVAGTSLSADFANFRAWESAERAGGHWTVTWDLSDLPDDGIYTLEPAAVDRFGNAKVGNDATVVLDRDAPDLGATVEQAGNDGRVILRSDEALQTEAGNVDATVTKPAGNDEAVTLTRNETAGEYVWDGTFALGDDGDYTVTASAPDRTGNVGEATSTAEIETVSVAEDRTATVVLEKSGLFIEFRTTETGFDSTVTVTESRSALAPLSRNLAGVNFLNGQLGKDLTRHLDNATIGIPVEQTNLPKGVDDAEQVNLSYYNPDNGKWELLDTRLEDRTVDGETRTYWVTEVDHFSTYGAVADDRQAPQLDEKSPTGTFDADTTQKTVTLNYSDDISGVDPSAVELYFDGEAVTDASATSVTGAYATYNATGLDSGTHATKIVLEDEAGNAKNYTASFTIARESSGGGGGGGGGGGSAPPPPVTVEVTELTDTYAEAKITSARASSPGRVSFDGGLAAGDATFNGLTVTPKSSDTEPRFFVEAESAASPPDDVSAFEGAGETLGYLTVTPTYIDDADLDSVAVQFEVDSDVAESPKNVGLYRYDGGSWTELSTESTGQRDGAYQFEASAGATGTFAVGLDAPAFEVREATLDATEVAPGEDVTVSATVENVGSGEGSHEVGLVVDGETVATQQVTLAPGETTTVEFTRTFEPGEYAVAVGSVDAGTLKVGESTEEQGVSDEQEQKTRNDGNSNSGGIPGFGVPAALIALLAAALLARPAS